MERLTDNTNYCTSWSDCEMPEGKCVFIENCYDRKVYNRLREYEDLEEQGLLIRLPVPLQSKVYSVECGSIVNEIVWFFQFDQNGTWAMNSHGGVIGLWNSSVFATKEEAEKALAEMWTDHEKR